jgi:hypothetical protein
MPSMRERANVEVDFHRSHREGHCVDLNIVNLLDVSATFLYCDGGW